MTAVITGVAELAPRRETGGETDLTLSARVGAAALADADIPLYDVDGLLTHPMSLAARLVPSTLAEFMGLHVTYADAVDLGGATGVGMLWRAAAAIQTGMCSVCLCITAVPRPPAAPGRGPSWRSPDRSPYLEFEVPYGNVGATEGYAQIGRASCRERV